MNLQLGDPCQYDPSESRRSCVSDFFSESDPGDSFITGKINIKSLARLSRYTKKQITPTKS